MRISTVFRYLIGDRQAILDIASDRSALWVGLLFVLSAGLAREYDGEDLLHGPWHAFIPLVASTVTSFLLFTLVFVAVRRNGIRDWSFATGYRQFLTLFWMTAPLAWLYAPPWDRMTDASAAMSLNILTLATVSIWRVALITRVITIVCGVPRAQAMFLVMFLADILVIIAVAMLPIPPLALMGGVHVPGAYVQLAEASLLAQMAAVYSFPVWLVGAFRAVTKRRPEWAAPAALALLPRASGKVAILGWLSVLIWVPILPLTQPAQQLRWSVEHDFEQGRVREALATLSLHRIDEFPPGWEPPPRPYPYGRRPDLIDCLDVLASGTFPLELRKQYVARAREWIINYFWIHRLDDAMLIRLASTLSRSADYRGIAEAAWSRLEPHFNSAYTSPGFSKDGLDAIRNVLLPATMPASQPQSQSRPSESRDVRQ